MRSVYLATAWRPGPRRHGRVLDIRATEEGARRDEAYALRCHVSLVEVQQPVRVVLLQGRLVADEGCGRMDTRAGPGKGRRVRAW